MHILFIPLVPMPCLSLATDLDLLVRRLSRVPYPVMQAVLGIKKQARHVSAL